MPSLTRAAALILLYCSCGLLQLMAAPGADATPRTRNPHGRLSIACEACHTATSWKPIRPNPEFDHNRQTAYPLRGMHADVACQACHRNPVFKKTAHDCASCHADLHRAQMGADCSRCHTVRGWTPVQQAAAREHSNRFPLLGAHAAAQCESCHTGAASGVYAGLSTECVACHRRDFTAAQNPPHASANFPTDCATCHSMNNWLGAKFDHAALTRFPLTGVHATLACSSCHVGGRFAGTPAACLSCHQADLVKAVDPNHVQAGFPTDCSLCHSTSTWANATFDHATFAKFPLTGAHATLSCSSCHVGGKFAGTPAACSGCHMAAYQQTTNPNHTSAGFSTDCSLCHSTSTWAGAVFDHSKTVFPLTGAHVSLQCSQCHTAGTTPPTSCDGCHMTQYRQTTNPNHTTAGFPTACAQCHNTTTWANATFDHNAVGNFPLTGAHTTLACTQCHSGGNFATAPRTCDGCHMTQFNQTTNPNHAAAGFPTDCSLCHNTTSWANATFDHSKTVFPLTGAHITLQCAQCHTGTSYSTAPTTCDGCHMTQYNQTANPNHAQAGFPVNCSLCHSTTNWTSATFDHSKTAFPLTGAHTTVACANCHVGGNYTTVPTDCYSCHKSQYTGVQNPNHIASGFPTTCATCHNTSTWSGATFNHTWFPIYSGNHARVWTTCADCHTNPSAYATFSCTNCHTHSQASTDPRHKSVRGYSYAPTTCYQCHPRGTS